MKIKQHKIILLMLFTIVLMVAVGCQKTIVLESTTPASTPPLGNNTNASGNSNEVNTVEPTQEPTQEPQEATQNELEGVIFFVGDWEIWIPGGYATTESSDNGDGTVSVTKEYVAGQKGKVLTIKANHTYRWETPTAVVDGQWDELDDGRIMLVKGQDEYDWYVEKSGENEIKYYSYGVEEYGTRIK